MRIRRNLTVIFMTVIMMVLMGLHVNAQSVIVKKEQIVMNGEWQDFTVQKKWDCNRHQIIVTQAGELSVTLQAFCGYNYVNLRDPDLVELHHYGLFAEPSKPKTEEMVYDVLPGVYYVEFDCYNNPGSYRIKAKFTPANNNEIEPNNTYAAAQKISFNQKITGFLTKKKGSADYQDLHDYYKLVTDSTQKVKITYNPEKGNGVINIYDSNLNSLKREWRYKKEPYVWEKELTAGTYYIHIESANEAGKYTILAEAANNTQTNTSTSILIEGKTYSDNASGGVYRVIKEDKDVCFVVEQPAKKNLTYCKVPDYVNVNGQNVEVVAIADNAFKNCTQLKTVEIGRNVTSVGAAAFSNCKKLTAVKGGKNITSIGKKAFYGCRALKKVNLSSSNLKKIDANVFQECTSMTSVSIGSKKLTSIGANVFSGCKKLKSITIKSTKLKSVGKNSLKGVSSNCKIKVAGSKQKAYKNLFKKNKIGKSVKIVKF